MIRKNITTALALALLVVGFGVANAGYFGQVEASFDRAFTEPVKEYNFGPVLASFDRAFAPEQKVDYGYMARRSYERMLGEGVFVKQENKLGSYAVALAGWEEMITKRELCDTVSPVLLACTTK